MTLSTCGSGHVQGGGGPPHRVSWTCLNCELELEFGLIEQPTRCHVCGSRDWRSVGLRSNTTSFIAVAQRT